MQELVIIENVHSPETWEYLSLDKPIDYLIDRYPIKPKNSKIFKNSIDQKNDITPIDNRSLDDLINCKDKLLFVIFPSEVSTFLIFSIVMSAFSLYAIFFVKSEIPQESSSDIKSSKSPNNSLGNRVNTTRLNGRIPDIYGKVRSYPDLIQEPLRFYVDDEEYELDYMVIGRGDFSILDVRDGDSLLNYRSTPFCCIWGSSYSVLSDPLFINYDYIFGDHEKFGSYADNRIGSIYRVNEIDGIQVYDKYESEIITENGTLFSDGRLQSIGSFYNNYDKLKIGDKVRVNFPVTGIPDGIYGECYIESVTYEVSSVIIQFFNYENLTNWDLMPPSAPVNNNTMYVVDRHIVGPITIKHRFDFIQLNLFADGLFYAKNKTNSAFTEISAAFNLRLSFLDSSDDVIPGYDQTFSFSFNGSKDDEDQPKALTVTYEPIVPETFAKCLIELQNTTDGKDFNTFDYFDIIKLKDLYTIDTIDVRATMFNGLTNAMIISKATHKALSPKERKFNCLVHRIVREWIPSVGFDPTPQPSSNAGDILIAVCLDLYIGNKTTNFIECDNIKNTIIDIETTFGTDKAIEFNYTFDETSVTFEDTYRLICEAIHCIGFKRNGKYDIFFEKEVQLPSMVFNHRNKLPKSEIRTIKFGTVNNYDSVEVIYIDELSEKSESYIMPNELFPDQVLISTKKIETIGVRNRLQAFFLAARYYNRLLHEAISCEFTAMPESNLLILKEMIYVSDDTRPDTIDGYIVSVNALEVKLSQPIPDVTTNGTIYVQHYDKTVEDISFTKIDDYTITLSNVPRLPLVVDDNKYTKTAYMIQSYSHLEQIKSFLVTEKNVNTNRMLNLKCINYDNRYYENDYDYRFNNVDDRGNPISPGE